MHRNADHYIRFDNYILYNDEKNCKILLVLMDHQASCVNIYLGQRGPLTWLNHARQAKKSDISFFFYFFLRHAQKKQRIFFENCINPYGNCRYSIEKVTFQLFLLFPPTRIKILIIIFPPLRQGTKHPCLSSSTKQYSESGVTLLYSYT